MDDLDDINEDGDAGIDNETSEFGNEPGAPDERWKKARFIEEMDGKFGFKKYTDSTPRNAWLINMHPNETPDEEKRLVSAVDYYFIEDDGSKFKVSLPYKPYFYVAALPGCEKEVIAFLTKKFSDTVESVQPVQKEDLDLPNHLIGLQKTYIKLSFLSEVELGKVKKEMMGKIIKNREREKNKSEYTEMLANHLSGGVDSLDRAKRIPDQMENIVDIREYDVPFHVRVAIDNKIFVGHWYTVVGSKHKAPEITLNKDLLEWPDPVVLAYDIETTKLPLKFPDAETDQIIMISYMIDGQGFLIVNREIVSEDVEDFEYTPKPEYPGVFTVFNERNEKDSILRFFNHIQDTCPQIYVTYNGDFFDWPFVETRAKANGLNMLKEIGFEPDSQKEYKSRSGIHMDAFRWVKRDSYLPVGSQNLKATTRAKLRYDPVEVDPEEMCRMAREDPQKLANYSVSDAVSTYYLYMKYVHPFIFALCTIIPMEPDEVLRKGSGTLCEALLMVEAFHANVIFPNKQQTAVRKFTQDGRLLDTETYVGGHVEALESGVFRADIPCRFRLVPAAFKTLRENVGNTLKHALEVEEGVPIDQVENFEEECDKIREKLQDLQDTPSRLENPIIYHLDVGAMYPNIILTNRLQPPAIINSTVCSSCHFNKPGAKCQRTMPWMWRGEVIPARRNEYSRILQQLENEKFPPSAAGGYPRAFHMLRNEEQAEIEKKRVQDYCKTAYKKTKETRMEERQTLICQRENSFYVDTVRAFRDRRYEYKGLLKAAKKSLAEALKKGDESAIKSSKGKEILFDSLQLAHKCILNSFYGYVMRRGSRWFSMEMAGIVCYTGAGIIKQARELIEQIGRPLELDTDGIWCILPSSFPENYTFKTKNPKKPKVTVSYPGAMLNVMVQKTYTNHQYHELKDPESLEYEVRSENSIFFEVDGPYLAMVLPASKEEGKKLKKRYAVFNFDGSLAELKGFEVKRRGELEVIKIFQSSVFEAFLKGKSLEDAYESVAKVANYWLDVLYSKAVDLPDSELLELISENRSMSRKLSEYGAQKSLPITTAKRLAEFLGEQMVQDSGLACKYIISRAPYGAPVTERAVPVAIFQAEPNIRRHFLKKWLKTSSADDFEIRNILDWAYYVERLGGTIQKIITIPAALQSVTNPVPRVVHPDWLHKRLLEKQDMARQRKLTDIFQPLAKRPPKDTTVIADLEDITDSNNTGARNSQGQQTQLTGGLVTKSTAGKKRTSTGAIRNGSGTNADEEADQSYRSWKDVLGPPPGMGKSKSEQLQWLAFQKKKWALIQAQKAGARKRAAKGEKRSATANHIFGMQNFIQASANALSRSPWQILQVYETGELGVFRIWALVGEEMHKLRLKVPRIFYVNQRTPKAQDKGENYEKVHRVLPRSNIVHHLYEYRVDEKHFQEKLNQLLAELSAPSVEGIYETQVPLIFRVLVDLGCVCKVLPGRAKALRNSDTFSLGDLEFKSLTNSYYLRENSVRQLYFYHYTQETRSIWGLFVPASRKAFVWIVNTRARTEDIPNVSAIFASERTKKLEREEGARVPKDQHEFEVKVETSLKEVYRGINRVLKGYRDEKRGPTFIAVQSEFSNQRLCSDISQFSEFPLVRLNISDGNKLFDGFNWQRTACLRLIQHYINVFIYLDSYVNLCRYLHIPLGNVPKDEVLFGADLFFARHLRRSNHLLWCSPGERPDLGGKELDDNRLIADLSDWATTSSQERHYLVNEEGFYSWGCVELDVGALPVSALLQSHRIAELEGGEAGIGFEVGPPVGIDQLVAAGGNPAALKLAMSYDEAALCSQAFKILKHMVHEWVKEISEYRNEYADEQVVHFYRWLRSTDSLLYDPALKKKLNALMKKLTLLLIAKLKEQGATVIHATFSRVIICTKKYGRAETLNYAKFVMDNLQAENPIFGSLDLSVKTTWDCLLWLDSANYGGMKSDENSMMEGDVVALPPVEMNWNIMSFLPESQGGCQSNFKAIVAGYILIVYREILNLSNKPTSQKSVRDKVAAAAAARENSGGNADVREFSRELVSKELTSRLFTVVEKIQKKCAVDIRPGRDEMDEAFHPSQLFPQLPGSHLNLQNPALELIKSVSKVLGLDSNISDEMEKLKRDCLKLIGQNDFSDEAIWRDPCLSYVLPEILCQRCNHFRDLDLCRDPGSSSGWNCVQCGMPYNLDEIQATLLHHLNRLSMAYNLQDLTCMKCRNVKQVHMRSFCECTGSYTHALPPVDFCLRMKTFHSLGKSCKMKILEDAAEWILLGNNLL